MTVYRYSDVSLRDLIDRLEHALDEIDETLASLGSLPTHRRMELRLHSAADDVEHVQRELKGGTR